MILPKNAASLISDSLDTARDSKPAEESMDEMEALGHSILHAIKSNDAKALAEHLADFQEAMENSDDDSGSDESGEGESEDGPGNAGAGY